jgi:hypothetical protein
MRVLLSRLKGDRSKTDRREGSDACIRSRCDRGDREHLIPRLVAGGHDVIATTRSPDKMAALRALGAAPVVVDGLDAHAVGEAVARAEATPSSTR